VTSQEKHTQRTAPTGGDPGSAGWMQVQARLADLALGTQPTGAPTQHTMGRHLAFLPTDALDLDLSDPLQRDFGDYELVDKLGQGGMGVVYRARQKSLDREVAVKLLAAGPWASADFIERFRREAQSAARMQHPNIVAIYEVGAHDELNYFSMMLVRGPTLAQVLAQKGPMAPRATAQLVRTIAEALDYAHRLNVLHLDLKPGNVLIDETGVPMVADFGLSRRIDEALAADHDEVSGTPSYMAPEQAQLKSHKLSPATDIYGLGAILYELLTGRPPFLAATPQETLKRVVGSEPARPRSLRADIPLDLEAVALKCLAKDPRERYASARALADDLGRYVDGRAVSVRPLNAAQRAARWARREPRLATALGAFLFALVSGLVATAVQWRRADANAVDARDRTWNLRAQAAQASLTDGDGFLALRPLVANLAEMEAAGRTADAEVERQRIGTLLANSPQLLDHIVLPGRDLVNAIAISPDGQRFAAATLSPAGDRSIRQYDVASRRELWTQSTMGLTFALPLPGTQPHGDLSYTADGHWLLATLMNLPPFPSPRTSDGVLLDARDGRVSGPPTEDGRHLDLVFSPNARFALARYRSDPSFRFPDGGQFYSVEPWRKLGPRHVVGAQIGADMWLPTDDGRWFLGSSDFSRFTMFETGTLVPRWRLSLPAGEIAFAWRFNADGRWLALGCQSGAVHLVDTRDGTYRALPASLTTIVRWVEFGADGAVLAAASANGAIMAWDVASRTPLTAHLAGGGLNMAGVRVIDGRLYAVRDNLLKSWSLPTPGPFEMAAVLDSARIRSRRQFWVDGFDVHTPSRLLVSGGSEGAISLWRLPPPVLLPARAAPLPPRSIAYDGERIVAVDGAVVQLREPFSDAPRSVSLVHPENVRLAELAANGRLVTVAGRTVRVFDPATGSLVGAPLVLPQSPLRADLARAAPVLALTTGEHAGDAFRERVHVIDLDRVALREVEAFLPFIAETFQLDPLGRYLLAHRVDMVSEARFLEIVDLTGAGRRCQRPAPADLNVLGDVAIADDGRTAWIYVFAKDRTARLDRWDLEACTELLRIDVNAGRTVPRLIAIGDGVVVHRQFGEGLSAFDAQGHRREAPGLSADGATGTFAVSADAHRAALATRDAVQLIDLARGERVSAPLVASIAANDAIMHLAFSPDASELVARTARGRWLAWRLPVTTLDSASLATLATLLAPESTDTPADPATVAGLIERLNGASASDSARQSSVVGTALQIDAAPGTAGDPRFVPVDLATAINAPLNGAWPIRNSMGGDQPTMAPGPLRLLDIDWRVDGGIQLSWGGPASTLQPTQHASAMIPVGDVRARRVHLLMLVHIFIQPDVKPFPAARVVLVGADGRETVLEPMMVRDVVPHWTPERAAPSARIGWIGLSGGATREGGTPPGFDSVTFAVSLDVPPAVGPIRGLRLETRDGPMEAPLFYAVTLEVDAAPSTVSQPAALPPP